MKLSAKNNNKKKTRGNCHWSHLMPFEVINLPIFEINPNILNRFYSSSNTLLFQIHFMCRFLDCWVIEENCLFFIYIKLFFRKIWMTVQNNEIENLTNTWIFLNVVHIVMKRKLDEKNLNIQKMSWRIRWKINLNNRIFFASISYIFWSGKYKTNF